MRKGYDYAVAFRIRWLILGAAAALLFLWSDVPAFSSVSIIAAYATCTAMIQILWRRGTRLEPLGPILLTVDLLAVTAVVYLAGTGSDAYHFYFLVIVTVAMRYGLAAGLGAATASGILYNAAVFLHGNAGQFVVRLATRDLFFLVVGVVTALLSAEMRKEREVREEKEHLLEELREAHEQLQEYAREKTRQAVTDGLTGLYNHSHLMERLDGEIRRAERYGAQVSLIMLDLDSFKEYNDALGHPHGNVVVKQVAELIKANVRAVDIAARYGGDEFAVVLPETGTAEATAMADRIRQMVFERGFRSEEGAGREITVSAGIATYPVHGRTRTELIEKADRALYHVKRTGRNRVFSFSA